MLSGRKSELEYMQIVCRTSELNECFFYKHTELRNVEKFLPLMAYSIYLFKDAFALLVTDKCVSGHYKMQIRLVRLDLTLLSCESREGFELLADTSRAPVPSDLANRYLKKTLFIHTQKCIFFSKAEIVGSNSMAKFVRH